MARPDYSSDDSSNPRRYSHSPSLSPPPRRNTGSNGHSHSRRDSTSPPPPPRSRRRLKDSTDPADREKQLAEQLRRRALASKEAATVRGHKRKASPSVSHSDSRSPSRSPFSAHSSSPPPRPSSKPSVTMARAPSPSPPRSITFRSKGEDRQQERRRRRSGRDEAAEDAYDDMPRRTSADAYATTEPRSRHDGSRTSHRREDRHTSRARTRDIDDDIDEVRSHRSGHSRHTGSREPEVYSRRDRDEYRRREPAGRHEPWERDDHYARAARHEPGYRSSPYHRGARDYYDYDPRRSRRRSPSPVRRDPSPEPEDYELRSVFCSQLAARLTQRDLGEFFEEKLGENTVQDVRIVTDRVTGRSKGIAYVELTSEDIVPKAIACSGEVIFGIPILVQVTDAARNRGEGASTAQAPIRPNLPENGLPKIDPSSLSKLPLPPHLAAIAGNAIHLGGGATRTESKVTNTAARLYVGSLHFNLVDTDVRAVFEPFGEIESVDLHREPDGKSKGFAFVQFQKAEDAEKAIEHMNGFELAGRNIRVGHVNSRGQDGGNRTAPTPQIDPHANGGGGTATVTSSFDEGGGGGLNAYNRANLMQMLARNGNTAEANASIGGKVQPTEQIRPASIPQSTSKAILLKNMFDPAEETEANWDTDLATDVKDECEAKYGKVQVCHVDKESSTGEIYLTFEEIDGATKAIAGLNGRWFGGRQVAAGFISESFLKARFN